MKVFSDTQLQDYVDGRMPRALADELEATLADDLGLAERLHEIDLATAAPLRAGFAPVPPQSRLNDLARSIQTDKAVSGIVPARFSWPWLAGTAAAGFVLAAVMFAGPTPAPELRWQDQVAIYQALYVVDTLRPAQETPGDIAQQLSRGSAALGRALPVEAVGRIGDLNLLRAQVLGFDGEPLIQMAYLTDEGVPIALCALRGKAHASEKMTAETLAGLETVHWSDGDYSFMIVGDVPAAQLLSWAEEVRQTL